MMRMLQKPFMAWLVLTLSLIAWSFVGFLLWRMSEVEALRAVAEDTTQEEAMEFESALRLRTLAREIREDREALEEIARADAISIIETIEQAGDDANAAIEVVEISIGSSITTVSSGVPAVHSVEVTVQAEGAFQPLMRAALFLSTLPVPSEISQVRFEKLPQSANSPWRLVARLTVVTIADISS